MAQPAKMSGELIMADWIIQNCTYQLTDYSSVTLIVYLPAVKIKKR